jgi:hypothetical protein
VRLAKILVAIALVGLFVNPWAQSLMYTDPLPYMLSHYALYTSGMLLGTYLRRIPRYVAPLGALPPVVWHLPSMFTLGGVDGSFRLLDHLTMFSGGLLMGSYVSSSGAVTKVILFALYMVGDTYLAIVFLLGGAAYTVDSPYSPGQFSTLGLAMLILMNIITAYVVFSILRVIRP